MFFANMRINMEHRINMKNKRIEFDCVTLAKILGISNEGPIVFEVKVIPTINGFGV
jgi:hypothetical protein